MICLLNILNNFDAKLKTNKYKITSVHLHVIFYSNNSSDNGKYGRLMGKQKNMFMCKHVLINKSMQNLIHTFQLFVVDIWIDCPVWTENNQINILLKSHWYCNTGNNNHLKKIVYINKSFTHIHITL